MSPVRKLEPAPRPGEVRARISVRTVDDPARRDRVLAILQRILDTTTTPEDGGQP